MWIGQDTYNDMRQELDLLRTNRRADRVSSNVLKAERDELSAKVKKARTALLVTLDALGLREEYTRADAYGFERVMINELLADIQELKNFKETEGAEKRLGKVGEFLLG